MRLQRQNAILSLLRRHRVGSQEQLQGLLETVGHSVNQATLSRDLRALGVVKEPQPGGGARYRQVSPALDRATAVSNLRTFLYEALPSGNLLVLKTRVGGATPVALAIDQLEVHGVLGTVAGDDTVLCVAAPGAAGDDIAQQIWALTDER